MLFSEPKIPQFVAGARQYDELYVVSVLFSEPKIPQSCAFAMLITAVSAFQCSSASRKFLNLSSSAAAAYGSLVSVLFSEPKIPQSDLNEAQERAIGAVSVLFSEPKIPQ